jgi:hypothetical protein
MMTKEHILAEIRRTATSNGGVPLGVHRFFAETGVKESDWHGKFWARWGDALKETGFQPNEFTAARTSEDLLHHLAGLVRELGRFPVKGEIKLKARSDPSFPSHNTFRRLGGKRALAAQLEKFCRDRGEDDLAELCVVAAKTDDAGDADGISEETATGELGYVYLMKAGRYYKIGRTNALGRRERELATQLPEAAKVIHSIKTDDPGGIEEYWHRRFQDRRKNGEWFELTAVDLSAFRRRKFM